MKMTKVLELYQFDRMEKLQDFVDSGNSVWDENVLYDKLRIFDM